jgi:uncharacterized membrane protein YebE (DUF533 family)
MNALDAFHSTVHSYPGGCEALAARMGIVPAVLRNKANPNFEHNKPTLADADHVMALSGNFAVLHALAQNHGHVAVQVEAGAAPSETAIVEAFTQVWIASGQVGAEVHAALADGRIDPYEMKKIEAAVYSTVQALHAMAARIKGMTTK